MKRWESQSCWRWRHRHNQSLRGGNENEGESESEGCDVEHESFPGSFIENGEEEWDKVEKRMTMTTTRGESEDDPVGSGVGGDLGG